jgi:aryl-alcohol dehydrogenase-like predicted oxidoreductase
MVRRKYNGMNYRTCGGSGLWLSEIGLGLWKWGDPTYDGSRIGEHDGFAVLDRALELGITHWDTANAYNMSSGNSERLIGRYLASRDHHTRDAIVLATKIRNPVRREHELERSFTPNETGASRKYVIQATEACLRRLNTDYIDILYHHGPSTFPDGSWDTPLEETWSAFEDLVRQGKVRYLAVSNRKGSQLKEENDALRAVAAPKDTRLIAIQNRYNLVDREKVSNGGETEAEFMDLLRSERVGLIPLIPLAVGFLTGRYRRDKTDETGRLASKADKFWADSILTDRNYDLIDILDKIASAHEASIAQVAIAWLLSHEEVPSVIAGVTKMEQLEDNAKATAVELTEEELIQLDELTKPAK